MMKIRKILQGTLACLLVLVLSASFVVPTAMAAAVPTLMPTQTFSNPKTVLKNRFGHSVATDGDYMVIGDYTATYIRNHKVYLYQVSTGELLQTFSQPNSSDQYFGSSVAIDGDYVLIVSLRLLGSGRNSSYGSIAYLYQASTGELLHTYNIAQPSIVASIDGDYVVIGEQFHKIPDQQMGFIYSGRVSLYKASTGELLQTLSNPNPAGSVYFGSSVAIDGDYVVIGAPGVTNANNKRFYPGKVYLYKASTGELLQTFSDPNPNRAQGDELFGSSVDIDGDYVVIGAERKYLGAVHAGEAYLYQASTGELLQTLNFNPAGSEFFGSSVDIDGDYVVIGARNKNVGDVYSGAAYLYQASTGELLQTFSNPNPAGGDNFGGSVAIDGNAVVIGAYLKDVEGLVDSGAVYLYNIDNSGSTADPTPTPTPAVVINIDAQKNNQDNPVIKSLKPGTYKTHLINTSEGGKFDAWNTVSYEKGCDANGEQCDKGWETRYYFKSPYNKVTDSSCSQLQYESCRYSTAVKAAAKYPEDVEFTISKEKDVKFYIYDTYDLSDNQGGISLEIIKQ
jgi:hypothetical protein